MFSDEFAREVVARAGIPPGGVLLDPWLGSGTATAAATLGGLRAFGVDINPVMVTVARGRSVTQSGATTAMAAVRRRALDALCNDAIDEDPLLDWFSRPTASALRAWQQATKAAYPDPDSAEAAFVLTSIFEAARILAKGHLSKNPTWVKRPGPNRRARATPEKVSEVVSNVAVRKSALCPLHPPRCQLDLRLGTSTRLDLPDAIADLVLTSPPYCTRIDYAVTTRIELAVLGQTCGAIEVLRDRTMGTSTVRPTRPGPLLEWGPKCLTFLDAVEAHPSKASSTYYVKTHKQYFDDLFRSLAEISRCTKRAGKIVIVVQDSSYKDLHIDLAGIVVEMGTWLQWECVAQQDYPVKRTMRQINTRSLAYRRDSTCHESVISFCKSGAD
jgi:SAM-dependent methyltransferase